MKLLKVLRTAAQLEPDLLVKPYCLFATPWFSKIKKMANFKGRYGSITDNTVHSVQMDNTIQQDNTGWHN